MEEALLRAGLIAGVVERRELGADGRHQPVEGWPEIRQAREAPLEVGDRGGDRLDVDAVDIGAEAGSLKQHDAAAHEGVEHAQAGAIGLAVIGRPEVPPGRGGGGDEQGARGRRQATGEPLVRLVGVARPNALARGHARDLADRQDPGVE